MAPAPARDVDTLAWQQGSVTSDRLVAERAVEAAMVDTNRYIPLDKRQDGGQYLPYHYDYSGAEPGQLVGIVLGVVLGVTLIIVIFWAVLANRTVVAIETDDATNYSYRTRTKSSRRRRRRSSRHEMSERSASVRSAPRRRENIIVEETRRTTSRPPPEVVREEPPMPPSPIGERRVDGDDIVEVIEEMTESGVSSERPRRPRRTSGYRTVDPNAYGGGNYAQRPIYGDERRRSSRR